MSNIDRLQGDLTNLLNFLALPNRICMMKSCDRWSGPCWKVSMVTYLLMDEQELVKHLQWKAFDGIKINWGWFLAHLNRFGRTSINHRTCSSLLLVAVLYLEIYMEELRDLLKPNTTAVRELCERESGIVQPNLHSILCENANEMLLVMNKGNKNRTAQDPMRFLWSKLKCVGLKKISYCNHFISLLAIIW